MPGMRAERLVEELVARLREEGHDCTSLSRARERPARLRLATGDGVQEVWLYIWTVTGGGRDTLPHEMRIQMTRVEPPLSQNPNGPTLLMGFEPDLEVFAGFDFSRHRRFTQGSPSIQINVQVLQTAVDQGIGLGRRGNDEVVVGVRQDCLLLYMLQATEIHSSGRIDESLARMEAAATGDEEEAEETEGGADQEHRTRMVELISRWARDVRFRDSVLRAYGYRCAVSRMQLRLVDAAHILPVVVPGSTDDVNNGIALSPTFHRAFDAGLIYLTDDRIMVVNEDRVAELNRHHLAAGLQRVRQRMGRICLPPDRRQWPSRIMIRRANEYRNLG